MIARLVRPFSLASSMARVLPMAIPQLSHRRRMALLLAGATALTIWPATALWPQANDVDRRTTPSGLAVPDLSEVVETPAEEQPAAETATTTTNTAAASDLRTPPAITPLTAAELCGDLGQSGDLDGSGDDRSARQGAIAYCANIADEAADARYARKLAVLAAAEAQIEERLNELETRRAAAEEWLRRRAQFMSAAEDSLVAIISAMRADSAALQLAELDPVTAAAVIARLSPRDASDILSEMTARDGARLAAIIAGLHRTGIDGSQQPLMDAQDDNVPTLTPGGRS